MTTVTTKRKPKLGELADPNSNRSKKRAEWLRTWKPKKKKPHRAGLVPNHRY